MPKCITCGQHFRHNKYNNTNECLDCKDCLPVIDMDDTEIHVEIDLLVNKSGKVQAHFDSDVCHCNE